MIIRKAQEKDVELVFKLGQLIPEFMVTETDGFWSVEELKKWAKSKTDIFLIAENAEVIEGFVLASYNIIGPRCTIDNILVIPEARGRGIGSQLIEAVEEITDKRGCKYFFALTKNPHSAIGKLFLKKGYTKGERLNFWLKDKS